MLGSPFLFSGRCSPRMLNARPVVVPPSVTPGCERVVSTCSKPPPKEEPHYLDTNQSFQPSLSLSHSAFSTTLLHTAAQSICAVRPEDRMHVESEKRREFRVLVIGATGHLGRHIVRACADAGHRTYALIRPAALSSALLDPQRSLLIQSFKDAHVRIIQGSLEDHAVLVAALKQVNVVVSVLGTGSLLKQLQLIKVMKIVGSIERFIPSEFGVDVDRITPIPALQTMFEGKVQTRRAIETAGIPYTYISSNCLASSFLGCLLQPGHSSPPSDRVVIYGTGDVKGVYVDELDVATYTAKTIDDPRTINKTLYIRPLLNILTQNEMVSMWESKSQKKLEKMHLSDLEMEVKVQEAPYPISALLALIYIVCIRGDTTNFDIEENCCEACMLYSDVDYTTASNYLDQFLLKL